MSTFGTTIFGESYGSPGGGGGGGGGVVYTGDYTGSFNGWNFGAGTNSGVIAISGLEDLPDLAPIDTQRLRDHGEFYTQDYAAGRTIDMDLLLLPGNGLDFSTLVEQFKAATVMQASPMPLVFQMPTGRSRMVMCRPRRRVLPVNVDYSLGYGVASVQFHANDPRLYDPIPQQVSVASVSTGTGLSMPLTFPLSFGGAVTGGALVVNNYGNFGTRPVVTIHGGCTRPYLSGPNGETLLFNMTLAPTDSLVIDFDARSVVLNGEESRYSTLVQPFEWFELPPGASNVYFGASAPDANCLSSWVFRSAWM